MSEQAFSWTYYELTGGTQLADHRYYEFIGETGDGSLRCSFTAFFRLEAVDDLKKKLRAKYKGQRSIGDVSL